MFLVLIETSGNQNYIFSTNKLKENIGASELTYQAGTFWVLEAIAELTGRTRPVYTAEYVRRYLLDATLNSPIESDNSQAEIIIATSGKALLIVKQKDDAQKIIKAISRKALKDAPGLEITGVFIEFDWNKDQLGKINSDVHELYKTARAKNLGKTSRFSRLPIVDSCQTSGLPASVLEQVRGEEITYSSMTASKKQYAEQGIKRLLRIRDQDDGKLLDKIEKLERKSEDGWLAVIHADGNGLGEIFLKFDQHIGAIDASKNRDYINKLRNFSIALDICTEKSFRTAYDELPTLDDLPGNPRPIVPLIVGGDDLTVVCDGTHALKFTHTFLTVFEAETQKSQEGVGPVLAEVAEKALGVGRLSACAGVAIIKPHFPFSVAYDLAADLMKVAKTVKTKVTQANSTDHQSKPYPCSALDFHVVYDSSDVSLDRIREKLTFKSERETTLLYQRPYVTTALELLQQANGQEWAEFHHWQKLNDKVAVLQASNNEERRLLPNSQIHVLRTGVFQGKQKSDAQYQLIRSRYLGKDGKPGIQAFEGESGSLFASNPFIPAFTTALVDVIDASPFMEVNINAG